jgi:hypothetical protein
MATPSSTEILSTLRDVTQGANRAAIEAEPGLAWLLPALDAHTARLGELVGRVTGQDATREIRAALALTDARHDDGHRFLHGVLAAFEHRGTAAERQAVIDARRVLYPEGLSGTQINYRREVDEGEKFKNRIALPEVKPGLDLVTAAVPGLPDAVAVVLESLDTLRAQIGELLDIEAGAVATPATRDLFEARLAATRALATFVQNVEYALQGDDPARVERRDRLTRRWRGALADATRRAGGGGEDPDAIDLIDEPADAADAADAG